MLSGSLCLFFEEEKKFLKGIMSFNKKLSAKIKVMICFFEAANSPAYLLKKYRSCGNFKKRRPDSSISYTKSADTFISQPF